MPQEVFGVRQEFSMIFTQNYQFSIKNWKER